MLARLTARWERWLLIACAACLAFWLGAGTAPAKVEQGAAKVVWQYRQVETPSNAIQATLEDLGRDGWEVFNVYGAAAVNEQAGVVKLVPHTFYVFAKKPQ